MSDDFEPLRVGSTARPRCLAASRFVWLLVLAVLELYALALWGLGPIHPEYPGDFGNAWAGAMAAAQGQNPYNQSVHLAVAAQNGVARVHGDFIYPPVLLILYRPLTLIPWPTVVHFMVVVNVVCFAISCVLLVLMIPRGPHQRFLQFLVGVGFWAFHPVQWNIVLGNINPLILLLSILGLRVANLHSAGAALGIAAAIKITPAALIGVFLAIVGQWRTVIAAAVIGALFSVMGVLAVGIEIAKFYVFTKLPSFLAGDVGEPMTFLDNQAAGGFFARLFTLGTTTTPWIDSPLLARTGSLVLGLTILAISLRILFTLEPQKRPRFAVLLGLTLSVIIPQYTHAIYQIWLLPVYAAVVCAVSQERFSVRSLALGLVLLLSFAATGILFPYNRPAIQSGPLLVLTSIPFLGAIMLWFLLIALSRSIAAVLTPQPGVVMNGASPSPRGRR